jgi:Peptidase A4 family
VNGAVAGLVALAALAAGAAPAAPSTGRAFATRIGSDAQVSSNWAGYALTGTNPDTTPVAYTNVTGTWVQPKVTCAAGESYSAFWVGLGGFTPDAQALEQIGTESNCTASGRAGYTAWYEIIPAPSIPIRMKIRPGDRITTAVLVQGTQVILQITNRTTHVRVTKRVTVAEPDLTSAEWIAEAPSECSRTSCQTLPLANFGTVAFTSSAATGDRHAGTISDPAWTATPIELSEGHQSGSDALVPQPRRSASGAVPGALSADGRAFSVVWHPVSDS